jgi:Ca2+-binding EF-hand superfamily protein
VTHLRRLPVRLAAAAALTLVGSAALAQGGGPSPQRVDTIMKRFDADADGRVTGAEITAVREARFKALDADGDGRVSEAELLARGRNAERMGRAFRMHDANGDGFVDATEFAARGGRFVARFDADGDGAVTRAELENPVRGKAGKGQGG